MSTTPKLMKMLDLSITQPIDVKTTFLQVSCIELMQVEAGLQAVVEAHVVDRLVDRLLDQEGGDGGELGDPHRRNV